MSDTPIIDALAAVLVVGSITLIVALLLYGWEVPTW